jgi:alpha-maltose-1-phosphate synthase
VGRENKMQRPEVIVVNLSNSGSRLGGAAVAAQWHSLSMAEKIDVELWRMWDENECLEQGNLRIRNFASRPKFGILGKFLPRLAQKLFLESDILQKLVLNPPKIVHLQNPGPALEFERISRVCRDIGSKIVVSTHGFQEVFYPQYGFDKSYQKYGWNEWIIKPIEKSFENIDAFLLGYPKQKDLFIAKGVPESKLHLVPNGTDPFFCYAPSEEEYNKIINKFSLILNHPTLLFIGNHTGNKGLDTVMKIAANITVPVNIVVGGRLVSKDEPKKWFRAFPPSQNANVIFTDYLSTVEQRVLYHLSTLLLFPSLSDTLPLTILESMASGLPVLAYDVGGIHYQLAENAGVVVPAGDFTAFINAAEQLLQDESTLREMKNKSRLRQQSLFSWDLIADRTIEIYQHFL